MTIQIGRAGQAGYTLRNPSTVSLSGDMLSMTGTATGLDSTTLVVLRDQFRGLNYPIDEPVIPVVFSSDTNLTGFYTDISVDFDHDPGGYDNGWVNWSFSGRRIDSAGLPMCESRQMNALRTNDLAITSVRQWWGPPPGVVDAGFGDTTITRSTEDGNYINYAYTTASAPVAGAGNVTMIPDATRWYEAAASFSVAYGGTYRKLTGRQVPKLSAGTSGAWAISTGPVRLSPSSTAGALLLEGNTAGTWRTLATVQLGKVGSNQATAITSVNVTRNTPAVVVARVGFITASIGSLPGSYGAFDIVARHGAAWFECSFGSSVGGFEFNGETGATFTGGMQRSANDANGNRWFGMASLGLTTTTASSANMEGTANSGYALGGLISGGSDTTTTVREQYFWTMTESVNFVTR